MLFNFNMEMFREAALLPTGQTSTMKISFKENNYIQSNFANSEELAKMF